MKKILLGMSVVSATIAPIVFVVSCGTSTHTGIGKTNTSTGATSTGTTSTGITNTGTASTT